MPMHAYRLQFNDHFLNPDFITGISASCCDRLLYINLLGSKHLRACMLLPMDEETRFRFIGLQDTLLETVQANYESHVAATSDDSRQNNEELLIQVLQDIMDLRKTLELKFSQSKKMKPAFASMIGPWRYQDIFIAIEASA